MSTHPSDPANDPVAQFSDPKLAHQYAESPDAAGYQPGLGYQQAAGGPSWVGGQAAQASRPRRTRTAILVAVLVVILIAVIVALVIR